jgi:hypothetical protein
VHLVEGRIDRDINRGEACVRQRFDLLRREQRAIRDQRRDHADLRGMSDHRREISVDKRLTASEMHEPNAVAFQDVAGELCLGEGNGMPRRRG